MAEEMAGVKLEAVAAMAKSLAEDVRRGKLWEGELPKRIAAISQELAAAASEATRRD